MAARSCVVVGAGGHAKMVVDALQRAGKVRIAGVTELQGKSGKVLGVPILGDDRVLPGLLKKGTRSFVVGVGGVPDNRPRAEIFKKMVAAGFTPLAVIHPAAVTAESAEIGGGSVVLPGAVVNPGTVLGANVIVNSGAVVEHDCRIADHAHVAPGAVLCGAVDVGEGAFVGAGAVVIQGVKVGAWAVIGAGSVVLTDVPPGARVVGCPARLLDKRES